MNTTMLCYSDTVNDLMNDLINAFVCMLLVEQRKYAISVQQENTLESRTKVKIPIEDCNL